MTLPDDSKLKRELDILRKDPNFVARYGEIVSAMRESGLLAFLRTVAHCYISDGGANPYRSAAEAQYNAGYHKALDDIMYFEEAFKESKKVKNVPMDFGGRRLALARGDLLPFDFANKGDEK